VDAHAKDSRFADDLTILILRRKRSAAEIYSNP